MLIKYIRMQNCPGFFDPIIVNAKLLFWCVGRVVSRRKKDVKHDSKLTNFLRSRPDSSIIHLATVD